MRNWIGRRMAAFFVAACALMLAGCEEETPLQTQLYKAIGPQCAEQKAVLAIAFVDTLDRFVEADGAAAEAAAHPVGELVALRRSGREDSIASHAYYGQIAFAFYPYAHAYFVDRGEAYGDGDAVAILLELGSRVMADAAAVASLRGRTLAAPCVAGQG